MHSEVSKAVLTKSMIELIYMTHDGIITKRKVKPFKENDDHFLAYCYLRRSVRKFKFENVLACSLIIQQTQIMAI